MDPGFGALEVPKTHRSHELMSKSAQSRILPLVICSITLLATGALSAQQPADVQVGEKVPDHEFGEILFGDGRTKLSEYIGQPVLLEWWGTR
jgi:hypothetical protein